MEIVYLLIIIKAGFLIGIFLSHIFDDIDSLIFCCVGFILLLIINIFIYNQITKYEKQQTTIYETVNIDSIYHQGYKRGQIDCQNDSIIWKKVMNNDGEIIYQKIQ